MSHQRTKVSQWGNSLGLRLPKHIAEQAGLTRGSMVYVSTDAAGVIHITPAKERPSYELGALLDQITPDNLHDETSWGGDVGKEHIE